MFVQYLAALLHIQEDILGTTALYLWGYSWLFRFIFRMVWLAKLFHIQEGMTGTTASYAGGYDWHYWFMCRRVWLALLLHTQEGKIGTTASYAGRYDWHYCFVCRRVWFRISGRKPTVMTEASCLAHSPQTKFRAAQYISCTSCQVHQSQICRSVCIS